MIGYRLARAGAIPVSELPGPARTFAEIPYSTVTESSRQYHLRTYERWCRERREEPWPPTLERLLRYGAESARAKSYFTVREHLRIISMVERRRSGIDLYAHPTLQTLLQGVERERPPAPVLPLRSFQVERLFNYRPRTQAQHRMRAVCLLSYAAGFRVGNHVALNCDMVSFQTTGAIVSGLSDDRPVIFIGRAQNIDRCPVDALERLICGRSRGPVYLTHRNRVPDGRLSYNAVAVGSAIFGRAASVTPLSIDRIRLAGLLEQIQHIDIVRLAHFHGYRQAHQLANLLGRYVAAGQFRKRRR